jgi:hypothetical protein
MSSNQCTCPICFEYFTDSTENITNTPCNHKFHSSCLFKNFEHRYECPLCRTELIKCIEEDDDEDEDEDDDEDDSSNSSSNSSTSSFEQSVSIKQMAKKLIELGYTFEDILLLHFGGSSHKQDIECPRWHADLAITDEDSTSTDESIGSHVKEYNEYEKKFYPEPKGLLDKLQVDIDYILEGTVAVSYTDSRSYASIVRNNK